MPKRTKKCDHDESCDEGRSIAQTNLPAYEEGNNNEAQPSANAPTIGEADPSSEQGAPPPRRSDRAEQLIKNKTYRSSVLVQSWSATIKRAGHHGATIAPKVEAAVQLMSRSAWMASRLLHSFVSAFPEDADNIISEVGCSAMSNAALNIVQTGDLLRSQAGAQQLLHFFTYKFAPYIR